MSDQKLKLGLLLDSLDVPVWLFHSIEQLSNSGCAEFSLVIIPADHQSDVRVSRLRQLWLNRGNFVYELLNKIDEKLFVRENNALAARSLHPLLAQVPTISIEPITTQGSCRTVQPADLETIRIYDLDILIQVGCARLQGDINSAARYGVWFYEPNGENIKRASPPGFWEVAEDRPTVEVALSCIGPASQTSRTVYRSLLSTYRFSPARTRNISLWASSSFLPRQIELLYRLGDVRFFHETARFNCDFHCDDRRRYQPPTNLQSIRLYTRLFFRDVYEVYQRLFSHETWQLMFDLSNKTSLSMVDFKKISPPKDRFWADPHVIKKDDKYFIFVEEFVYKIKQGHISVIEMDRDGNYSNPVPVLKTGCHLSYPFVFEHDHQYYLIPESSQRHTIDLYECVEFPYRWEYKLCLIDDITAVDSTLFFHQGKWWLFTGVTENAGAAPEVELYLYFSDDLFSGEWQPHPLNPVVSDVSCARPAGKLFTAGGKIYRPSQDCSKNYGSGFNINEIVCLSETEYLEKRTVTVKPNWDTRLIGAHTFTRVDGLNIIDGLSRRSKLF